jgi:murein DD-endopeptidase MepM/ murein hydrolase activator NlpD
MWFECLHYRAARVLEMRQNQVLRQDLYDLQFMVQRLQATTQEWFALDDHVRSVFGLPGVSTEERMLGVGGVASNPSAVEEQFDLLRRRAEYQEFQFAKVREELLKKVRKWSQMPTAWPCDGRITSGYGFRIHPITGEGLVHEGLDIAAPPGAPVLAPADGIVEKCDRTVQYGNLIVIRHGDGVETRYGHLRKILVSEGQAVKRNDLIGLVGQTGLATGPHLHFEVRLSKVPQDPETFLLPTEYVTD